MKIQFASDLHLEFPANSAFLKSNPLQTIGDILILGGDIVPFRFMEQFKDFFKFCSDHFEATYWIPGNHEYYHSELGNRIGQFKEEIESNVFLLNNQAIDRAETRIILSTLWSSISSEKAWYIQNVLNDYRLIKDKGSLFTSARSTELFNENLAFIQKSVLSNQQKKCVVVTHHVPTFTDYPKEYRSSNINEAFATDLNEFNTTDKNIALQIVSGREGISLAAADYLVFFNLQFSAVSYFQAKDRLTTMSRKSNDIYWIFAKNGIEEKIYKQVMNKKNYTINNFRKEYNIK